MEVKEAADRNMAQSHILQVSGEINNNGKAPSADRYTRTASPLEGSILTGLATGNINTDQAMAMKEGIHNQYAAIPAAIQQNGMGVFSASSLNFIRSDMISLKHVEEAQGLNNIQTIEKLVLNGQTPNMRPYEKQRPEQYKILSDLANGLINGTDARALMNSSISARYDPALTAVTQAQRSALPTGPCIAPLSEKGVGVEEMPGTVFKAPEPR